PFLKMASFLLPPRHIALEAMNCDRLSPLGWRRVKQSLCPNGRPSRLKLTSPCVDDNDGRVSSIGETEHPVPCGFSFASTSRFWSSCETLKHGGNDFIFQKAGVLRLLPN